MTAANASIVVAVITMIGGIIVAFIQAARKENHADHAVVQKQLNLIFKAVNKVDERVEQHLDDHREGQYGKPAKRVKEQ